MTGMDLLQLTAGELERLLTPAHVMGQVVDLGDRAIIPVVEFGFGFGAGYGNMKRDAGKTGEGAGSGGGGGITPVALVIIHKDRPGAEGIQVLSLRKDNPVAQVISALSESLAPQVIQAIKAMNQKKEPVDKERAEQAAGD
jgi:uncharacterized spore protein YtfJ